MEEHDKNRSNFEWCYCMIDFIALIFSLSSSLEIYLIFNFYSDVRITHLLKIYWKSQIEMTFPVLAIPCLDSLE